MQSNDYTFGMSESSYIQEAYILRLLTCLPEVFLRSTFTRPPADGRGLTRYLPIIVRTRNSAHYLAQRSGSNYARLI
jgi:hypothetical protein